MGGTIGLTVRVAPGKEYRGSCWTNVLPTGLWAAPFYDPDKSAEHAWAWVQQLLEHRAQVPNLERMYGDHNLLAPISYGIVVVDYVTGTLISAQGYSAPDWIIRWPHDEEGCEKWDALEAAGRLGDPVPWWSKRDDAPYEARYIKLPFKNVLIKDVDGITPVLMKALDEEMGLSDAERAGWEEFIKERDE